MRVRVAVVHPRLGFGGSEARALWAVEALKHDYDVSLITSSDVDVPQLNDYYGTGLDPREFSLLRVSLPLGLRKISRFAALRGHLIQRYCQRVASRFDVMISAYNPCDFGVRGIQCIADFSFIDELRSSLHPVLRTRKTWWYGDSVLRRSYLKLCSSVSPSDPEAWKRNLTLANSNWSAQLMRERYGIEAPTLYPPVADDFPVISYEEREKGFVCIGRWVPEKRVHTVIEILAQVRQKGHDVHLHVVGGSDDSQYVRALRALCRQHREWVFLEGAVFGEKKKALIARHRFGINACENEAFGIATAEMVKAGCLVWVPNGGGQVEIVNHPSLVYKDSEDAVRKIEKVLNSAETQHSLREHLARGAERFSVENFQKGVREIVREFLEEKRVGGDVAKYAEQHA